MAGALGRVSMGWPAGLSLGAAGLFVALASWTGGAPPTAVAGGAVWVFILAMIVSMPLVAGRARRREAAPGTPTGGLRRAAERSPMLLTLGIWLCTLPFLFLLLGPWFGVTTTLVVTVAWAAAAAGVCWMLCTVKTTDIEDAGGGR